MIMYTWLFFFFCAATASAWINYHRNRRNAAIVNGDSFESYNGKNNNAIVIQNVYDDDKHFNRVT